MSEITSMLQTLRNEGGLVSEEVLSLIYSELRRLASAQMARESPEHTLQPTAVVHEAWLRLTGENQPTWQNRAHFFGAATEAMRRILIESARRKSSLKRGGGQLRLNIESLDLPATTADEMILLITEALHLLEMQDSTKAQIVAMKFFGGLTNREVGEQLGVTERTVERQWAFAKAWLFECIRTELR